ncbi:MarR family winged helix-turn-helix transcriptional regulator [Sphingomonas abietis]|uniref:Winged helix DNA-binding protein n=1 Tax=Sphingomonas abietis TaxID=3012344 RepID=A0ABY7NQS9_9SPHN|nr:MarR family transcriptional regulator [Sphingomonas abietis]WBO22978.1 winged helix DNA-binding protein [Sphingomonas abietis]
MDRDRYQAEASFGRRLLPLSRRWHAAADRALLDVGLSNSAGWALLHVGRLGDDVRQSDLVAELDMQGASVVRVLDQLEMAGLLARKADPADRRANRLRLTDAGRAMVGRIEVALATLRRELTEGVPDSALEIADAVLERIDQRMAVLRERDR